MILRQVKSFVLRNGKITLAQQRAIEKFMPLYGISYKPEIVDLNNIFMSTQPKIIEIGFGMGRATSHIALHNTQNDYLGIEVHSPGVGSILMEINQHSLTNLKIIQYDAVMVLRDMISDNSISGFHIFFPDPWPKKRHHKRRIIQKNFVDLLCTKLKSGGYIHLATDWQDYAMWMLAVISQNALLVNTSPNGNFIQRPLSRPETKFEKRGLNLGHGVWDLMFIKK